MVLEDSIVEFRTDTYIATPHGILSLLQTIFSGYLYVRYLPTTIPPGTVDPLAMYSTLDYVMQCVSCASLLNGVVIMWSTFSSARTSAILPNTFFLKLYNIAMSALFVVLGGRMIQTNTDKTMGGIPSVITGGFHIVQFIYGLIKNG